MAPEDHPISGGNSRPGRRPNLGITAAACVVFVAGMVGMSFAAVPLYRVFCRVTGFGGATVRADTAPGTVSDRMVTVRFDANVANGLGWSFRPVEREVTVPIGAVAEVAFVAKSRITRPTVGTAAFNVTPLTAGAYFNKIDCFCFSEQSLAPGEEVTMPVVFFVDPAMLDDPQMDFTDTLTLSYTFFPAAGDKTTAAAPVRSEPEAHL